MKTATNRAMWSRLRHSSSDNARVIVSDWNYAYGTRLRYVAIAIATSLESSSLGYEEGLPIRDLWEDFMNDEVIT